MADQQQQSSVLPQDFLSNPAPNISVNQINFAKTPLTDYAGCYALVLDNVLNDAECEMLIRAAEATTEGQWERAMVNVGGGRQVLYTDTRNCGRIIWDSPEVVDKIWQRIANVKDVKEITELKRCPKIFGNGSAKRNEVWKFSRINERMRFLKYVGGEYFKPHCDGSYEREDHSEKSYFTLQLYLNNGSPTLEVGLSKERPNAGKQEQELVGGATTFHSPYCDTDKTFDVMPRTGRIMLFQHSKLVHSGADVLQGTKYTMRTDLMYTLKSSGSKTRSFMPSSFG